MILNPGEKIHVIHRQLYERDTCRHFIGTVESCDGALARVTGYLYAMDNKLSQYRKEHQFVKRDSLRTRIIPLDSSTVIVNVLPSEVKIEDINYSQGASGDMKVTDGGDWRLDLSHL